MPQGIALDWFDPQFFNARSVTFRERYMRNPVIAMPDNPFRPDDAWKTMSTKDWMDGEGGKILKRYNLPTKEELAATMPQLDIDDDFMSAPYAELENSVKRWYEGGEAALIEREAELRELDKSIRVLQKERDKKAVARGKEKARQRTREVKDQLRAQAKDTKGKGKAKEVIFDVMDLLDISAVDDDGNGSDGYVFDDQDFDEEETAGGMFEDAVDYDADMDQPTDETPAADDENGMDEDPEVPDAMESDV
jgi:hypothetical protein